MKAMKDTDSVSTNPADSMSNSIIDSCASSVIVEPKPKKTPSKKKSPKKPVVQDEVNEEGRSLTMGEL